MSEDESMSRPAEDDGVDVDLTEDPFADDLSDQLAAKAPRRLATRTTVILFAVFLAVGGFLAGAQVQKHWGKSGATATGGTGGGAGQFGGGVRAGASGFPGAGGFGGGQNQQSQASAGTTGTVKLVDGDTVYIVTADGTTVVVKTNGSTSVQTSQAGSLKDLAAGATVTVQGQTGTDGSVTATKITKTAK